MAEVARAYRVNRLYCQALFLWGQKPKVGAPECQIVYTTCADREVAGAIARALVEDRLAACVSILPAVRSVYLWEGEVRDVQEQVLIVKIAADRYAEVEQRIRALHPYELPEIIAVPIVAGLPEYLQWVQRPEDD